MPVHPDLTAYRAVDACGGAYTKADHCDASDYARGHRDALDAACAAVAKPDALMAEMLEALKAVMALRDRGFTKAVARDLGLEAEAAMSNTWIEIPYRRAREVIAKAEGLSPSTVGGR